MTSRSLSPVTNISACAATAVARLASWLGEYRTLLVEAFARTGKSVRLMGVGVRFAPLELPDAAQLPLL